MRHTPFLDKVVNWSHLTKRLVHSLSIIEDQIFCRVEMKQWFVMNDVQVVVNELFLERSVVALNDAVDLGTSGITNQIGDLLLPRCCVEFPLILQTIIILPVLDRKWIEGPGPLVEVLHIFIQ